MDDQNLNPPTVPVQKPKKKPVRGPKVVFIVLAVFVLIMILVNTFAGQTAKPSGSVRQMQQRPVTANPQQIATLQRQQDADTERMRQELKATENALQRLAQQSGDLNAQQSAGIPPMTPQQQWAIRQQQMQSGQPAAYGGASPVDDAKAEAKRKRDLKEKQRHDALRSSTVAIDFSDHVSVGKQAEAEPKQVSSTREDRPKPIDLSSLGEDEQGDGEEAGVTFPQHKKDTYDFNSSTGKMHRLFEGTIIEGVLTNRVNGDATGPINVMVTTDYYSNNNQVLLVPQGTRIIGDVRQVKSGNDSRLFVAFHRMIFSDGYSLSLDQFKGLNQIGEVGLKDLVDRHLVQIFGASLAVGAIGAVAQLGGGYNGIGYDPMQQMRNGISQQMAQNASQILNRFLSRLPTLTIRERARVKIYISNDLLLPAFANHTMDPSL